eukprot:6497294-Karenia_brevis.AAC.1
MAPSLAIVAYNARAVTKASYIRQLVCPSKDLLKDERRMRHRLMKYPSSALMDATCLTWGSLQLPQIRSIMVSSIAARTRVYWDQPAIVEDALMLLWKSSDFIQCDQFSVDSLCTAIWQTKPFAIQ